VKRVFYNLDFVLLISCFVLLLFGLVTMKTFGSAGTDYFFYRQLIWASLGVAVFFAALFIDWNFLKTNSIFLLILYFVLLVLLAALLISARAVRGAESWFKIYSVGVEPVELMKPVLVLVLAKYFSKRHVEIARFGHLFISSLYAALPVALVFMQPDLGSAVVLGAIWLGLAVISGIKLQHLAALILTGVLMLVFSWSFLLLPYQKIRIISFLNPSLDPAGAGYQATQSMIALGSGRIFGKGIGFGTQSRLEFLPEHTTDFIFAAFAEEWGLIGASLLFLFFAIVIWRILRSAIYGESNFEKLYAAGLAIFIFFQSVVHIGMNSGMLPITGLGMPFLSYGGSSLISLFFALGILQSFSVHKKGGG